MIETVLQHSLSLQGICVIVLRVERVCLKNLRHLRLFKILYISQNLIN